MVNVRKSSDRVLLRKFNIHHSSFPIPLHPSRFSRKSRESRTNNAYSLFERKENRLKNHTPQGKLPPQPIATTTHPYPAVRRVLPSGEVREWPNRAVSKTAVLATGPWVRSPPSPPTFKRLYVLVQVILARCLLECHRKCNLFPLKVGLQPVGRLLQVSSLVMPADLHGYRLRHPGPHEVPHPGPPKMMSVWESLWNRPLAC